MSDCLDFLSKNTNFSYPKICNINFIFRIKYFTKHAPRVNLSKLSRGRCDAWLASRNLKVAFNPPINNTVKMKLALFALFAGSAAAFAPAQTGVSSL